ncbi:hypothetical protein IT418_03325 [bacterium]|nr:hypothetical protein [bacterium]
MEKLKTFFKLFDIFLPFPDFLYILQLEEYSTKRLLKWLPRFFFRRNIQRRDHLKFTSRVLLTLGICFLIWGMILLSGLYFVSSISIALLWILVISLFAPIIVLLANILVSIYAEIAKKKVLARATQKIATHGKVKVIAVAGSYGKTTVKNFIQQLIHSSYKTQMIPGNINTPLGIANWIQADLKSDTEILIAEVDTYQIGEIASSCDMLRPDIAVLTNVGDQHLERHGNEERLALALSEVFTHSKQNCVKITTMNTKNKILHQDTVITIEDDIKELSYQGKKVKAEQLSISNIINLQFALEVASALSIKESFVANIVKKLELPERRQHQGTVLGYQGVDDSYNISFSTAKSGIKTAFALAKTKKKKLLVITGGIPELSTLHKNKNHELGEILEKSADFTIILGTMFAKEIASGFSNKNSVEITPDLQTFIKEETKNFKNEDWVLLLQPELNDLYY